MAYKGYFKQGLKDLGFSVITMLLLFPILLLALCYSLVIDYRMNQ
jgi:hypothetical protein